MNIKEGAILTIFLPKMVFFLLINGFHGVHTCLVSEQLWTSSLGLNDTALILMTNLGPPTLVSVTIGTDFVEKLKK